jgi:hypothetical protein
MTFYDFVFLYGRDKKLTEILNKRRTNDGFAFKTVQHRMFPGTHLVPKKSGASGGRV